MALRLDPRTRERLDRLASTLGVPRTTLVRRMIERETDSLWSLTEGDDDER